MIVDETLKLLCESSKQLYFLIDLNNDTIIYSNPSFNITFKVAAGSEFHSLLSSIHADDHEYVLRNYKACKNGEKMKDFECRVLIDDQLHSYKISITLLVTQSGHRVAGCTAEDITDLKKYLNVLNEHNKKKNSILNIVAHDLMGPLGIIELLSGLMSNHPQTSDDSRLQQYISLINRTSKKCTNLIRNFINQEFLESSGVNLVKRRVELAGKMHNLIDEYTGSQTELKKKFTLYTNKDKIYAEIDEDKFFQIINNLISNALKFTEDGGNIAISLEEQDTSILITVADDGIGIPEKHHATLFHKFNSARRSGLKGEESIGLGMSIIKTIVEWHNGKIWFESKENIGTTFYIEIPK